MIRTLVQHAFHHGQRAFVSVCFISDHLLEWVLAHRFEPVERSMERQGYVN